MKAGAAALGIAVVAPLPGLRRLRGVGSGLHAGPWSHRKSSFIEIPHLRNGTAQPVLLLELVRF